jgi:hypothetical protein
MFSVSNCSVSSVILSASLYFSLSKSLASVDSFPLVSRSLYCT